MDALKARITEALGYIGRFVTTSELRARGNIPRSTWLLECILADMVKTGRVRQDHLKRWGLPNWPVEKPPPAPLPDPYFADRRKKRPPGKTRRQVMELLNKGLTDTQICQKLNICRKTLTYHLKLIQSETNHGRDHA